MHLPHLLAFVKAYALRVSDELRRFCYRTFYCSRHGHRRKFSMDTCVNCGANIGWY